MNVAPRLVNALAPFCLTLAALLWGPAALGNSTHPNPVDKPGTDIDQTKQTNPPKDDRKGADPVVLSNGSFTVSVRPAHGPSVW